MLCTLDCWCRPASSLPPSVSIRSWVPTASTSAIDNRDLRAPATRPTKRNRLLHFRLRLVTATATGDPAHLTTNYAGHNVTTAKQRTHHRHPRGLWPPLFNLRCLLTMAAFDMELDPLWQDLDWYVADMPRC